MKAMHYLATPIILLLLSLCSIEVKSSVIKSVDFNPQNTTINGQYIYKIKLKDMVLFISEGDLRTSSDGVKLWRQMNGSNIIEPFFLGGENDVLKYGPIHRWDDDKVVFWVSNLDKWYQTDGTTENTREFTELNLLLTNNGATELPARGSFHFITTLENGNYIFIIDDGIQSQAIYSYDQNSKVYTKQEVEQFDNGYDFITKIGHFLFYFEDSYNGFLWRLDLNSFTTEKLVESKNNQINLSNFSFHSKSTATKAFRNDSVSSFLSVDISNNTRVIVTDVGDLTLGVFQTEQDGFYKLHIIKPDSGEIETLPIESESKIALGVTFNTKSYYLNIGSVGGLGENALFKVSKVDFSIEQLIIPVPSTKNCTESNEFSSYNPILVTEKGVLLKNMYRCSSNSVVHHLFFINENGQIDYLLNTGEGEGLPYHIRAQSVQKERVFFSAYSFDTNDFEIWKVDLETLGVSRKKIDRLSTNNSGVQIHNSAKGYSEGSGYYWLSSVKDVETGNRSPVTVDKINLSKGTIDSIHHFSNNITSVSTGTYSFHETARGVTLLFNEANNEPIKIYSLSDTYVREKLTTTEPLPTRHNTGDFFSHTLLDKLYYIKKDSNTSSTTRYLLNSVDVFSGEIKEVIAFPEFESIKELSDKTLLSQSVNDVFSVINLDTLSIKTSDEEYNFVGYCGNNILATNDGISIYNNELELLNRIQLEDTISVPISINEDGFALYSIMKLQAGSDPFNQKQKHTILKIDCHSADISIFAEEVTIRDLDVRTKIHKGMDGWFYLDGGIKHNRRYNPKTNIEEFFYLHDGTSTYLSNFLDTKYGLFTFERVVENVDDRGIISAIAYKLDGENVTNVAVFNGSFSPQDVSIHDPQQRIFNFSNSPSDKIDIPYFNPKDNSFNSVDMIPGPANISSVGPKGRLFASNGNLYISAYSLNGADLNIINLNCLDTDVCLEPLENSVPQIINQHHYDFTSEQEIYIPIRAKDPDGDLLTSSLSNAPQWLRINNDIIEGTVPKNVKNDFNDIVLTVKDSKGGEQEHKFTLTWKVNERLLAKWVTSSDNDEDGILDHEDSDDDNDGVNDKDDAFPLDLNESVDTDGDGVGNNTDSDDDGDGVNDSSDAYPLDSSRSSNSTIPSNSEGGGGGSMYILLLILFFISSKKLNLKS
jgi:hypothetical protein